MNTNQLNELVKLKNSLLQVKEKCDMEANQLLIDMENISKEDILSYSIKLGSIYARSVKLLSMQRRMYKKVKKSLIKNDLYTEDEIALDINEFISMGGAKALIGPITYTNNIPLELLSKLEFTWSDADFSKLYNSEYIRNLKYAFGPLTLGYISSPMALSMTFDTVDLTKVGDMYNFMKYNASYGDLTLDSAQPIPIRYIGGNINITNDENVDLDKIKILPQMEGYIYYEKSHKFVYGGNIYSIEEFLSSSKKYTKQ